VAQLLPHITARYVTSAYDTGKKGKTEKGREGAQRDKTVIL